jgi:hypothetical protein
MIAVTILALAVFGIFHAYSVGFLGMADTRDRTVATNYAREAMEDVKNMNFELITNENLSTAEIIDAKFTRVISVNTEDVNLKKITTLVYWNNRNGKPINVETTMYINRDQFTPGEADKIILYADPYYTVLPGSDIVKIIAVIKDEKGNTKIDWTGGDIHFSILGSGYSDEPKNGIGSHLGYLGLGTDEIYVTPNNGRAEVTFTASIYILEDKIQEGNIIIEASVVLPDDGGTISNTIDIIVTLDVVRVDLTASPTSIDANGISTSTITAELLSSDSKLVTGAQNNITFNLSGVGTFIDSEGATLPNTVTLTPPEEPGGTVTIDVKSINDNPGVAIVTASSEGILSDTVNIIMTGSPKYISILAHPGIIYTDDIVGATVVVTINDINGNPVNYTGTIGLSTNGAGTFDQNSLNFIGMSSAFTTFSSASPGIVTITASGDELISGNTDIDVQPALIANNIALIAVPQNILAGGGISKLSTIKAIIRKDLTIVSTYSNEITFEIISDTSSSQTALLLFDSITYSIGIPFSVTGEQYGNDGEAVVYLIPSNDVGICTIEVSTDNLVDPIPIVNTIEVGFYSSAHHIELSAVPQKMLVNGDICTITATIVDVYGTKVQNYNEVITFTFLGGYPSSAKFFSADTPSLTKNVDDGVAYVDLISQYDAGTAKIEAVSLGFSGSLNIPVGISLTLEGGPIYDSENKSVSFNINILGAALLLEEMQVSWDVGDPVESLDKIDIAGVTIYDNDPSDPVGSFVYTDNLNERVADIDATDTTLSTGPSTIVMYFSGDISGKTTLDVTFNPNSGDYLVDLIPL